MHLIQCHTCKEKFRKEELFFYCSPKAKTGYNYCRKCYEEKLAREDFSYKVCKIFGLKAPGPRIWTERQRLQETYGYTDQIITDCLEYVYNVKGAKKLAESLYMINPTNVDEMLQYKRTQESRAEQFESMAQKEYKYEHIRVRENIDKEPELENIDDCLNLD